MLSSSNNKKNMIRLQGWIRYWAIAKYLNVSDLYHTVYSLTIYFFHHTRKVPFNEITMISICKAEEDEREDLGNPCSWWAWLNVDEGTIIISVTKDCGTWENMLKNAVW